MLDEPSHIESLLVVGEICISPKQLNSTMCHCLIYERGRDPHGKSGVFSQAELEALRSGTNLMLNPF